MGKGRDRPTHSVFVLVLSSERAAARSAPIADNVECSGKGSCGASEVKRRERSVNAEMATTGEKIDKSFHRIESSIHYVHKMSGYLRTNPYRGSR